MGCSDSRMRPVSQGLPQWTHSLYFDPNLGAGFGALSEGMAQLGPTTVTVERIGSHTTDGARWAAPMVGGKHVYEVHWAVKKNRGTNSCIGVSTAATPLSSKGRVSLVGSLSRGWCLDMSRRAVIHTNAVVRKAHRPMPDRFFVYADMDAGKIGFGEDVGRNGHQTIFYEYYISGIQATSDDPLYLMVSSPTQRETMTVIYRGSHVQQGGYDLVTAVMNQMSAALPPQQLPYKY